MEVLSSNNSYSDVTPDFCLPDGTVMSTVSQLGPTQYSPLNKTNLTMTTTITTIPPSQPLSGSQV
eukprot:1242078-Ditylum_brightwellii.AAC.1